MVFLLQFSYMEFLKNLPTLTPMLVLKIIGIGVAGILLLAFAFQLIGSSFGALTGPMRGTMGMVAPGYGGGVAYDMAVSPDYYDGGYGSKAGYAVSESAMMPQLSARNSMPYPIPPQGTTGNDAEEFEVTQYSADIETRHLDDTCASIQALKARADVIFENANTYERGCNFTFKVERESVEDVLAVIKELAPKDLSEDIYTIKNQVDDFTSETEVLQKKRASIDQTLTSALAAYDEITRLATQTQNADALAKIIDSKIGIIERLTQERININEQLDRLARAKADQLDGLDYTRFNVNVYENKFVDGERLKDSWKQALREFVGNVNKVLQDLTVGLVLLLLLIAQWVLYAAIVLVVAKYGWKFGKYIWFR